MRSYTIINNTNKLFQLQGAPKKKKRRVGDSPLVTADECSDAEDMYYQPRKTKTATADKENREPAAQNSSRLGKVSLKGLLLCPIRTVKCYSKNCLERPPP